jgi:antitoxin VbhA-like protein
LVLIMSPRRQFIVRSHLWTIPILCEWGQTAPQIGRLGFVYSSLTKIDRARRRDPGHDDARTLRLGQWLQQLHLPVAADAFDRFHHALIMPQDTAECMPAWSRVEDMGLATHPITAAERARRTRVYEEALASIRLEGFELDEQATALYHRYVDGDLTLAEVGSAIDELDNREFGPVSVSRHQRPQKPPRSH